MEHFRLESQASEHRPLLNPEDVEATPVYPIIHMIRADAMHFIDTPLSYDALTAPDLTYTLVRPLHDKYNALQHPTAVKPNLSVVFALLVNRVHFLRDTNLSTSPVSRTRAELCELLAIRLLRDHGNNMLLLTLALTTSWNVYSGADADVLRYAREERDGIDVEDRVGNAIEIAIVGRAKRFIKSSACQKVIDGIWTGKCVYQAESSHSILSDTYKRTPIHFYDPHKAPLLDHYRLKVPSIRSVLEYWNFVLLFILFIFAIETTRRDKFDWSEIVFMVYALGFTLEKIAAMQEHGFQVYFKGTWNGFDLAFVTLFCLYATLRLYGFNQDQDWAKGWGMNLLALIAVLLFPRLAFVTLRDNLMVLALRAMIVQFVVLMVIAAFCFGGFLYALWILSRPRNGYPASQIAWWMLDLWFGLDASGFEQSHTFHEIWGPILMVTYACLSNTLLLTVLVSILSNTFATINEDAAAEAMFRKAVSTIEGVKADSLFSYQPPLNLIALLIMLPSSYLLNPRWFHKVNVFLIRLFNFPVLLMIAVYERQAKNHNTIGFYDTFSAAAEKVIDTLPRQLKRFTFFEGLMSGDADIDAIFEIEEEIGSALAVDSESETAPFEDIRGRRLSPTNNEMAYPKGSEASTSPTSPYKQGSQSHHPPAASPPEQSQSAAQAPIHPRTRLASIVNRGAEAAQHFTSPLAQIFQPLVVDDNMPDQVIAHSAGNSPTGDDTTGDTSHLTAGNVPIPHRPGPEISYGPANRRRLPSMQSRRTPSESGGSSGLLGQAMHGNMRRLPNAGDLGESALSESPETQSRASLHGIANVEQANASASSSLIAKAGEFAEGDAGSSGGLAQIQSRQARMEEVLLQIAKDLQELKKRN